MTIRRYLILMSLGTLLSWSVVILIITMINPIGSPPYIFIMFYFSIFLACIGSLSIIGFLSRILILGRHQFLSHQLAVSFRQAIILSFLLVGFLFLQSLSLLTWWIVLVAVVIVISVDFFISIGNRRKLEIRQDQG